MSPAFDNFYLSHGKYEKKDIISEIVEWMNVIIKYVGIYQIYIQTFIVLYESLDTTQYILVFSYLHHNK